MGPFNVTENRTTSIFMGPTDARQAAGTKEGENGQVKNGSIFAGSLNLPQDKTALTREMARKEAMKLVNDQFGNDKQIDQDFKARREHQAALTEDVKSYETEISKIDEMQQTLEKEYGITEDSSEQKDLDLLRKSMSSPEQLTDEEWTKLDDMGPLTDYQKSSLQYDSMKDVWQDRTDSAKSGIINENKTIEAIKQSLDKVHPMVDAQVEAAEIMENAAKEVADILLGEAKEKIDEEMEETAEEIEEKNEAKAEETKVEETKAEEPGAAAEDSAAPEDVQMQQAAGDQTKLNRELNKILDVNNLIAEDLKGIMVNTMI